MIGIFWFLKCTSCTIEDVEKEIAALRKQLAECDFSELRDARDIVFDRKAPIRLVR